MSLRIPAGWAAALVVSVLAAAVLFVFLLGKFGGPSLRLSTPYEVSFAVPDSGELSPRSEVLARGVHVGDVEGVSVEGDRARVTVAIDGRYAPLRAGTTVRMGEKTLFGESYVDLAPGPAKGREIPDGATLPSSRVLPESVSVDRALRMLDGPARRHLTSLLRTLGRGARSPAAGSELSASIDGLERTTASLRSVAGTLSGQSGAIAASVTDSRQALDSLDRNADVVRAIVTDGRATLGALASRTGSLRAGLAQAPPLLASARRTLDDARPLLRRAQPVARRLAAAAPPLSDAIDQIPATTRSMDELLAGLPALQAQASPVLRSAEAVLNLARPVATPLADALRNVQPIARYLSARRRTFASWFSNTGDLGSNRDAKGYFARFFVSFEMGTAFGTPGNFDNNAYTGPDDALSNHPYSGYPRLHGYDPKSDQP